MPSAVSSDWIDWLIADWTRPSLRAAAEKLPVSATAKGAELVESHRSQA